MSMQTYDEDGKPERVITNNPSLDCSVDGAGRTKQSPSHSCDINVLLRRYKGHGELLHISNHLEKYRDLTGTLDLHEAMTIVADAHSQFEHLPAEVRAECDHDPANFLPWIDDPYNQETAEKYGLLGPPPAEEIIEPTAQETEEIVPPTPPLAGGE